MQQKQTLPITEMIDCKVFINVLERLLKRSDHKVGVLMLDLDRFRLVNEIAGHDVGINLLEKVVDRLVLSTAADCIWANYWGDKFFLAVPEVKDEETLNLISQKILSACRKPWKVGKREFFLSMGIGIAVYPEHGTSAVQLMKHADLALAQAKERGSNNYQFYQPSFSAQITETLKIEAALRRTLERNIEELFIHYQPRIDLQKGEIDSFEALVRWNSKELGLLSPGQFIPIAEDAGMIAKIGEWVLINSCKQIQRWRRDGLNARISVNLSARQLYDDSLLEFVIDTLHQFQVQPEQLEIEITETMIMLNLDRAVETLKKLQKIGVKVALDDFGTGYSSLTNLKQLPIDTLKIDKSFIDDAEKGDKSKSIIQAIITLGHILDLKITAEGVEQYSQLALLQQYGCDEVQGFYFSRPISSEQASMMLIHGNERVQQLKYNLALDSSCL